MIEDEEKVSKQFNTWLLNTYGEDALEKLHPDQLSQVSDAWWCGAGFAFVFGQIGTNKQRRLASAEFKEYAQELMKRHGLSKTGKYQ
jgi:enamine deaminase RidA (YjgF/YER057c/UK114 family)